MQTELVAVNRDCDKKNRFYNITGMTEPQIQEIENRYKNLPDYFTIRR